MGLITGVVLPLPDLKRMQYLYCLQVTNILGNLLNKLNVQGDSLYSLVIVDPGKPLLFFSFTETCSVL